MPPHAERMADSVRNWIRTSLVRAPSALRMPISRVRSVTETSMIFMMPMPPTIREIAAIPPTAMERLAIMESICPIWPMAVSMRKSSGLRSLSLAT